MGKIFWPLWSRTLKFWFGHKNQWKINHFWKKYENFKSGKTNRIFLLDLFYTATVEPFNIPKQKNFFRKTRFLSRFGDFQNFEKFRPSIFPCIFCDPRDLCLKVYNFVTKWAQGAPDGSLNAEKRVKHVSSVWSHTNRSRGVSDIHQHGSVERHQKVVFLEFSWFLQSWAGNMPSKHAQTIWKYPCVIIRRFLHGFALFNHKFMRYYLHFGTNF